MINPQESYLQDSYSQPDFQLRPFNSQDSQLFARLYSCPRVMRQIQPAVSVEVALSSAARLLATPVAQRKVHYWVVAYHHRSGWQDIGLAALSCHSADTLEVGVMLLPEASNKKLGLRACQQLIEWAFTQWAANIVLINHQAGNLPAARIARQLGMLCLDSHAGIWRWQLTKAAWQRLLSR